LQDRPAGLLGVEQVDVPHAAADDDRVGVQDVDDGGYRLAELRAQPAERGPGRAVALAGPLYDLAHAQALAREALVVPLQRRTADGSLDAAAPAAVAREVLAWNRVVAPLARDAVEAVEHAPVDDHAAAAARAEDEAHHHPPAAARSEHRLG